MQNLTQMSLGGAAVTALLGYAVVFFGLLLLLWVLRLMGAVMRRGAPQPAAVPEAAEPEAGAAPAAPGSAGELKLYDTDPRDAAMVMAIVADTLGKPLNELRFLSIREVREDEI